MYNHTTPNRLPDIPIIGEKGDNGGWGIRDPLCSELNIIPINIIPNPSPVSELL